MDFFGWISSSEPRARTTISQNREASPLVFKIQSYNARSDLDFEFNRKTGRKYADKRDAKNDPKRLRNLLSRSLCLKYVIGASLKVFHRPKTAQKCFVSPRRSAGVLQGWPRQESTPPNRAMRKISFASRCENSLCYARKVMILAQRARAKILRCWPAMCKIMSCFCYQVIRNACDLDSRCGLACDATACNAKLLAIQVERCEPPRASQIG